MKNILIVDDSITMRNMIEFTLKNLYTVIQAVDGIDGLSKINDNISCVITDINMPNMNGIELIKEIRKLYKSIPILILTTEMDQDKKIEGKNAGATGWLVKPFEQDKLISTVRKVIP